MSRSELERHLRAHGCRFKQEGGRHALWQGPDGSTVAVPRHTPIKRNTARRICDQLGVPRHPSL